jgi:hypothetical protein
VRYQSFQLVSAAGEDYAAVPPFKVEGTAQRYVMTHQYGLLSPSFEYHGYDVWGPYHDFYASTPSYNSYSFDPTYYDTHYPYWQRVTVPLPTREMLDWALPEGTLKPGGSLNGFLYFEHVPEDAELVDLTFDIIDDETGKGSGTVRIPFQTD